MENGFQKFLKSKTDTFFEFSIQKYPMCQNFMSQQCLYTLLESNNNMTISMKITHTNGWSDKVSNLQKVTQIFSRYKNWGSRTLWYVEFKNTFLMNVQVFLDSNFWKYIFGLNFFWNPKKLEHSSKTYFLNSTRLIYKCGSCKPPPTLKYFFLKYVGEHPTFCSGNWYTKRCATAPAQLLLVTQNLSLRAELL